MTARAILAASLCLLLASIGSISVHHTAAQERATILLRGREQTLHLYGTPPGPGRGTPAKPPVIVSSGDGGWIHLAPHVAETLAAQGYFVVGFDTRAYLSSFTGSSGESLRQQDEPGDFAALAHYAGGAQRADGARVRPLLIGVSEGAGLSVLAATDPATRSAIAGVIALGLPDVNELAWRWRDASSTSPRACRASPPSARAPSCRACRPRRWRC